MGLSAAGEFMSFPMEQRDPAGDAILLQRIEHLNRPAHPAAIVFIRLDEKRRRFRVWRVFQRRDLLNLIEVIPWIASSLG